jgi:hypothetical protein
MGLPLNTNVRIDIWRNGNLANFNPDVANIAGVLTEDWVAGRKVANAVAYQAGWSHILLLPAGTDIRDGYAYATYNNLPDSITWPAGANTAIRTIFNVVFVEGKGDNTANYPAYLKVYLDRITPQWPSPYT